MAYISPDVYARQRRAGPQYPGFPLALAPDTMARVSDLYSRGRAPTKVFEDLSMGSRSQPSGWRARQAQYLADQLEEMYGNQRGWERGWERPTHITVHPQSARYRVGGDPYGFAGDAYLQTGSPLGQVRTAWTPPNEFVGMGAGGEQIWREREPSISVEEYANEMYVDKMRREAEWEARYNQVPGGIIPFEAPPGMIMHEDMSMSPTQGEFYEDHPYHWRSRYNPYQDIGVGGGGVSPFLTNDEYNWQLPLEYSVIDSLPMRLPPVIPGALG